MPKHIRNEEEEGMMNEQSFTPKDEDNSLGLTEAFEPLEDGLTESTTDGGRVVLSGSGFGRDAQNADEEEAAAEDEEIIKAYRGKHVKTDFSDDEVDEGASQTASEDDFETFYEQSADEAAAVIQRAEEVSEDESPIFVEATAASARHAKKDEAGQEELPPHLRKSKRLRTTLTIVIFLLAALFIALCYFGFQLFQQAQQLADSQAQQQEETTLVEDAVTDADTSTEKITEAPNLLTLLGLNQKEAIKQLERGAKVTSSRDVNPDGSVVDKSKKEKKNETKDPKVIVKSVTVSLTEEPADPRAGKPTVYLGINCEGEIIQAGYSASAASLGYGAFGFSDAVETEGIIENTLLEAGVDVPAGSAKLPANKDEYTTYTADGEKVAKEYCSFEGTFEVNDTKHTWSAVLSYDYTAANASGELSDTTRIIYVYINV